MRREKPKRYFLLWTIIGICVLGFGGAIYDGLFFVGCGIVLTCIGIQTTEKLAE